LLTQFIIVERILDILEVVHCTAGTNFISEN